MCCPFWLFFLATFHQFKIRTGMLPPLQEPCLCLSLLRNHCAKELLLSEKTRKPGEGPDIFLGNFKRTTTSVHPPLKEQESSCLGIQTDQNTHKPPSCFSLEIATVGTKGMTQAVLTSIHVLANILIESMGIKFSAPLVLVNAFPRII